MKKLLLTAVCMLSLGAYADEGMWTLYNLPQAVYEKMKSEGYELPYEQLYQADDAIMKSVVNFSGYCSGVVVSPDGLVFTNHHCGFEAIRSHSTVEHDYMLNGFCAKSYEEELPNKNMFVSFMVEQKDVTDKVITNAFKKMTHAQRETYLDSLENAWSKDVKKQDSTLRLELKPFYEGNRYFATTYRDFTDLRLVFTIPKSMGKFGGETDNWMWPRQTCDFSVFRIYADPKTNGPAEYSKDNVPYHPEHWARVSDEGYKEGTFSMTIGYPGSTSRYLSSYGITERYAENAIRAQVRGVKQEVMKRHMDASEAVRIKYDSKYAHSSNYWKNSIGMNKCIDSIGLIKQKQQFELQLKAWMDSTGHYSGQLDFDKMAKLYEKRLELRKLRMYWMETFRGNDELTTRAMAVSRAVSNGERYFTVKDNRETFDVDTDKDILVALLKNYRAKVTDEAYLPDFYKTIEGKYKGNYEKFVNHLYKKSKVMKSGKVLHTQKPNMYREVGVAYGRSVSKIISKINKELKKLNDDINRQEQLLCAAKLRMEEDLPHYSDANFTMRLSYGQVKEYKLGGWKSGYYTAASSMYQKMVLGDKIEDYRVEPEMKTLLSDASDAKKANPYRDTKTGEMQLCFLTTNDITGGNSGSPMFDGKNRLIGLAFDGNWDSLSSDIFFDSQLARCIGVDIRYVLFMMDRWGHADRLLREVRGEK
ncbi:S46 family peptidase [Prevotella sp. E13-27]|uniref:S46 family peptidase n=1 Tax=Prevotella sp. E13-27 TaxID=2938122 RepID=UPI00200A8C9C|nr:S46 family peptidase [Prevotella sp. E13-27]MCK8621638.1 S46 family peptidase [Prevotella sp. E13-27]